MLYLTDGRGSMSKYDFRLDLETKNSLSEIIKKIRPNTKVLELGCAHGRLTKYLSEELGCEVTIVEIDEEAGLEASKYSKKSFLGLEKGNLETLSFINELAKESFDYIIFADVLEHLRDPEKVISRIKGLLKMTGSILISVPNLCHSAVLIDLLNDKFEYKEIGLLDSTHIHFFTYNSLKDMVKRCGVYLKEISCTEAAVGNIEIKNSYEDVPIGISNYLKERIHSNTYQFIVELTIDDSYSEKSKLNFLKFEKEKFNLKNHGVLNTQVFLDSGNGFSEKESFKIEKKEDVSFKIPNGTIGLRFDPSERRGIMKIHSSNILISSTNALLQSDGSYIFLKEDPQIYLDYSGEEEFTIKYEYEDILEDTIIRLLEKSEDKNKTLKSEIKTLEDRNRSLKSEVICLKGKNKDIENKNVSLEEELFVIKSTKWFEIMKK